MLLTAFQPVTTENLPGNPSLLSFFAETGTPAKVVLGILLLFSLISWAIIFAKFIRLRRVSRQSEKFVAFFRKSKRFSEVNTFAGELSDTPLTTLFKSGYAELDAQIKAVRADDSPTTVAADPGKAADQEHHRRSNGRSSGRSGVEMSRLTKSHHVSGHDGVRLPVHRPLRHGLGHHVSRSSHRPDGLDLHRRRSRPASPRRSSTRPRASPRRSRRSSSTTTSWDRSASMRAEWTTSRSSSST